MTPLFVLLGAVAGLGVMLTLFGVTGGGNGGGAARAPTDGSGGGSRRAALAALVAVVVLVVTRWPAAALVAAFGLVALRGLGGAPSAATIERLEAIAAWAEMLRDTLAGAAGLSQAITATSRIAPTAIRPAVESLATRLSSGVAPRDALTAFGDALADRSADTIVATLCMASEQRAQRLGDLLGALAATTRQEVAMRLRIEASRASARTAIRTVAGFSVGFLGLLAVLARSYLAPFSSATGQVVLLGVGALFAAGLRLMAKMAEPRSGGRLVGAGTGTTR